MLRVWIHVCILYLLLGTSWGFSILRSLTMSSTTMPMETRQSFVAYNQDVDPDCIFVSGGTAGMR